MNWRLRQAASPYHIVVGPTGEHLVKRDGVADVPKERVVAEIPPHPVIEEITLGGVTLKSSGSYADIFPTMAKLIPPGKGPGWIIHAGACRGVESEILYKTYWRPMVAIEPASVNQDALRARMHDLSQSHPFPIKVLPFAVGNYCGRVALNLSYTPDGPWNESNSIKKPKTHLAQSPELDWTRQEEVGITTLDALWTNMGKPEVFMWYSDVEGAEKECLMGAQEMLKHTRYVFTEVSYSERYEGAIGPKETFDLLPGTWKPLAWWSHGFFGDILLQRID